MTFIVQADRPEMKTSSVAYASRDEAFETARRWLEIGYANVKVIGDELIYLPADFELKGGQT